MLVKVVIHGLLLNCKTGASENPQESVLTLVILTVFIIEMIDGEQLLSLHQIRSVKGDCRLLGRQD